MDPCSEQRDEKDHQLAESAAPGGTLVSPGVKREGQGMRGQDRLRAGKRSRLGEEGKARSREELESG